MSSVVEKNCTYLISTEKSTSVHQDDICKDLESSDIRLKTNALKNSIIGLLAGEPMPRVLMTVIRYCINCDDHMIKKLLMLYWELVPKYAPDGKLLPEMILVCNALRNDLMSPNEYIRGCMLRFLCKLKEAELLEPLIPSIKQSLEHRHSYVRRNAALAVYSIHKTFGDQLLPDGPELMETFINNEADTSARRNAFLMLFNEAEHIAIDFLAEHSEDIQKYGDGFALLVLELTRKTCRRDPAQKSRFVRCLFQLIQSESAAVSYEAAWTLVSLSSAPTAVRACAQAYTNLLSSCSDNNVKLIVLDRLIELKKHHTKVVQEILMDIMRALSSPNIDICKKTLSLAIDLVGPRNIEEVVQVLKREVLRTQESDIEHAEEYKALLIQAIHRCATRFAEVADSVVLVLLDFLSGEGGANVMQCVKSIVEQYPGFRNSVMQKVILNLDEITTVTALRSALWILGEYSNVDDEPSMLTEAYDAIAALLGETPFTVVAVPKTETEEGVTTTVTKNVVLADGTYASVTSTETVGGGGADVAVPHLRKFIIDGDILLGTVACVTLTKLTLFSAASVNHSATETNRLVTQTLLACSGIGQLAESKTQGRHGVHADCLDRLSLCCRMLLDPSVRDPLSQAFLKTCHNAFSALVTQQKQQKTTASEQEKLRNASQADDLIQFRQLRSQGVQGGIEVDLMDADDISRATGSESSKKDGSSLPHVHQLTGYSDPVYAEATVVVHDFDIILDILVINRTPNTLTNLTLELATMGDLKLVERPQSQTIGPLDERRLKANIKVSSTETGHIFGTIVFDNSSTAQKVYVNLSDIQLNIMDYIRPGQCLNENFRSMWAEFEWENKVAVNTNITDLKEFLDHIVTNTNMTCITPLESKSDGNLKADGSSNFLAANLYARSVFGEDALVNVSIERKDDNGSESGALAGYIRIRSKTQGIALSLGDRITSIQRSAQADEQ
jgi:coatomer subunit beta